MKLLKFKNHHKIIYNYENINNMKREKRKI